MDEKNECTRDRGTPHQALTVNDDEKNPPRKFHKLVRSYYHSY